jgi:hypothetical protein
MTIFAFLLGWIPFCAQAQESQPSAFDYALMKREYIGKNEIFSVTYKNESGKVMRINGYIRPAADEKRVAVYSYNTANRNYDIIEIWISGIQSIVRSEIQKMVVEDSKPVITAGGILKAAGITLIVAALALLIFYEKL